MLCVGEAALVDDQPGVHVSRDDRVQDPVVAKLDHVAECGRREPEQQEGSRLAPRHGDAAGRRFLERSDLARHHERPDAATQRRAAAEQPVAVAGCRGRPEAELGELELGARRAAVQLLDVEQHRLHLERRGHEPVHERVERERVVRARSETEAKCHERPKNQASNGFSNSSRVNGLTCSPWPSPSETVKSSSSVSFASWRQSPSS